MTKTRQDRRDGDAQTVAVLWYQDALQKIHIVGVFESDDDATAFIEQAHGKKLFESGYYRVTVRPVIKSYWDKRTWP